MQVIDFQHYDSPCGTLLLGACGGRLCLCDWVNASHHEAVVHRVEQHLAMSGRVKSSPTLTRSQRQLDEYFQGLRTSFDIPLLPLGTDFQLQVWRTLADIPYASTCSYADVARAMGRPSAVRTVANAVGANAMSIFLPCHRVVGSGGVLGGYAGGLAAKRFLLQLEQRKGDK